MTNTITFDQLPLAVTELLREISSIKQILLNNSYEKPVEENDQLLSIKEAANFLNLSVPTIYSKVSKSELPVMKQGNRLYFSRKELMEYLKLGRKKTNDEIAQEAKTYLSNKKGLNNEK